MVNSKTLIKKLYWQANSRRKHYDYIMEKEKQIAFEKKAKNYTLRKRMAEQFVRFKESPFIELQYVSKAIIKKDAR